MQNFKTYPRSNKNLEILKADWKVQRTLERTGETDRILPIVVESINNDQQNLGRFVNTCKTPEEDSMVHLMYYALALRGINTIRKNIEKNNN